MEALSGVSSSPARAVRSRPGIVRKIPIANHSTDRRILLLMLKADVLHGV